jgi:hypothetical protein
VWAFSFSEKLTGIDAIRHHDDHLLHPSRKKVIQSYDAKRSLPKGRGSAGLYIETLVNEPEEEI